MGIEHAFFVTNRAVDSVALDAYRTDKDVDKAQEDEEEDDDDKKWYNIEELT